MRVFNGIKIALLYDNKVVTSQRDNKPGLRFAGMWDLPGGGREGAETPIECAQRELMEELGIGLSAGEVIWEKEYPAMHDETQRAFFLVAHITQSQIDKIVLGDEGQDWKMMTIADFLAHASVVPKLKGRLKDFLASDVGTKRLVK